MGCSVGPCMACFCSTMVCSNLDHYIKCPSGYESADALLAKVGVLVCRKCAGDIRKVVIDDFVAEHPQFKVVK